METGARALFLFVGRNSLFVPRGARALSVCVSLSLFLLSPSLPPPPPGRFAYRTYGSHVPGKLPPCPARKPREALESPPPLPNSTESKKHLLP